MEKAKLKMFKTIDLFQNYHFTSALNVYKLTIRYTMIEWRARNVQIKRPWIIYSIQLKLHDLGKCLPRRYLQLPEDPVRELKQRVSLPLI